MGRDKLLNVLDYQMVPILTEVFTGNILLLSLYLGLIEKNEIGRACSVYGGEERHIQSFGGET